MNGNNFSDLMGMFQFPIGLAALEKLALLQDEIDAQVVEAINIMTKKNGGEGVLAAYVEAAVKARRLRLIYEFRRLNNVPLELDLVPKKDARLTLPAPLPPKKKAKEIMLPLAV